MAKFEKETGVPLPWLVEKSEIAGLCAARLVDKINQLPISHELREHLFIELQPLLYDLTKIISYVNDSDGSWHADVAKRILEQGTTGFKNFMSRGREFSENGGFISRKDIYKGSLDEPL